MAMGKGEGRVLSLWELQDSAKAMQEAVKMEQEREAYFQSLYDDVRYFGYRYSTPEETPGQTPSVEVQALEIIDAKQSYDRRISRKKEKYSRWCIFLEKVSPMTADIFRQLFEMRKPVDQKLLERALREGAKEWESIEDGRGKELDEEAMDYLEYMREHFPYLFRNSARKYKYLIDGEIVSMTLDQHEDYLMQQRFAEHERIMDDIRHGNANEYSNALYR